MSTNYHYYIQENCLIVTEPSAPGRSPDSYFTEFAQEKTDYEVLSGDISFDADVIRAIAKGQEKDPPQLLEKLNRGFETLWNHSINNFLLRIPKGRQEFKRLW